ncbi:hypothetical protein Tco_1383087, partial [Tanacetum coccineum]
AALAVATAALAVAAEVLLAVMKPVQSMSSPVTPVRRYSNLAPKYESYMLAVHSELPNSTQRNMPKPLGKPGPPDLTFVQSHSETIYP